MPERSTRSLASEVPCGIASPIPRQVVANSSRRSIASTYSGRAYPPATSSSPARRIASSFGSAGSPIRIFPGCRMAPSGAASLGANAVSSGFGSESAAASRRPDWSQESADCADREPDTPQEGVVSASRTNRASRPGSERKLSITISSAPFAAAAIRSASTDWHTTTSASDGIRSAALLPTATPIPASRRRLRKRVAPEGARSHARVAGEDHFADGSSGCMRRYARCALRELPDGWIAFRFGLGRTSDKGCGDEQRHGCGDHDAQQDDERLAFGGHRQHREDASGRRRSHQPRIGEREKQQSRGAARDCGNDQYRTGEYVGKIDFVDAAEKLDNHGSRSRLARISPAEKPVCEQYAQSGTGVGFEQEHDRLPRFRGPVRCRSARRFRD